MVCPACQATIQVHQLSCPSCGCPPGTVVEGSLAESPTRTASMPAVPGNVPHALPCTPASAWPPASVRAQPARHALSALPRVPALLWRQPAVRAAVRTGASAVVLSLAVRMAERFIAARGARSAVVADGLPALAKLLEPAAPGRRPHRIGRARPHTTETLICIRRTTWD